MLQVVEVGSKSAVQERGVGHRGGDSGSTGPEKGENVSAAKCSEKDFRSKGAVKLQAGQKVGLAGCVGGKLGIVFEGVAIDEVKWVMSRWRMSVQWKRYLVRKAVRWIRHGEGFIWFDGRSDT